jgi:hypothetical protein
MNDKAEPPARDEHTRPPIGSLRYPDAPSLYAAIPQVAELTQHRPRPDETAIEYLLRLRASTTPEEAITFTAFATLPQLAIWWGYECLRLMPDYLEARDRPYMEAIAAWTKAPTTDLRHRLMREALFAHFRSPAVMLALAVGWSGGPVAPNDPAPVPVHRLPRSLNSAVLSCLARAEMTRRPVLLARFITMAEALCRG